MNLTTDQFTKSDQLISHLEITKPEQFYDIAQRPYFSQWPLLHFDQIPQRIMARDPGYPILLRSPTTQDLPGWIFNPYLGGEIEANCYWFESKKSRPLKTGLIITSDENDLSRDWGKLMDDHQLLSSKWIYLRKPTNAHNCWPQVEIIEPSLHQSNPFMPDQIIDLSFGKYDTFSELHFHYLYNLSYLQTPVPALRRPTLRKELHYGIWNILRLK